MEKPRVIETVFLEYYQDDLGEGVHLSEVLADLVCWCVVNRIPPLVLIETSATMANFSIPDRSFPWAYQLMNDKTWINLSKDEQSEKKAVQREARAKVFGEILEKHYPTGEYDEQKAREIFLASGADAVITLERISQALPPILLVRDLFFLIEGDPDQFRLAMSSADDRYMAHCGMVGGVIDGTKFYEYQEVCDFFDCEETTDRAIREIGYDPTTKPNISGAELLRWIGNQGSDDDRDVPFDS